MARSGGVVATQVQAATDASEDSSTDAADAALAVIAAMIFGQSGALAPHAVPTYLYGEMPAGTVTPPLRPPSLAPLTLM